MGTLTAIISRITAAAGIGVADNVEARGAGDEFRVRALPNEDVYLFVRAIDNSRVIPQAEPRATRAALKSIAASLAIVAGLFVVLLPIALNIHAGYQLSGLELDRQRLMNQRAELERMEEALVSPARLAELAAEQQLVDPTPADRVPLSPVTDGERASR